MSASSRRSTLTEQTPVSGRNSPPHRIASSKQFFQRSTAKAYKWVYHTTKLRASSTLVSELIHSDTALKPRYRTSPQTLTQSRQVFGYNSRHTRQGSRRPYLRQATHRSSLRQGQTTTTTPNSHTSDGVAVVGWKWAEMMIKPNRMSTSSCTSLQLLTNHKVSYYWPTVPNLQWPWFAGSKRTSQAHWGLL